MQVGVLGSGTMGNGIAQVAASNKLWCYLIMTLKMSY